MYIKQGLLLIFVIMYFFFNCLPVKQLFFFFSDATLGHQMAPLQAKEKQRQLYSTRFVLKENILCSADFLTSTSYHTQSAQCKGAC